MTPPIRYFPSALPNTVDRKKRLMNELPRSQYPIRIFGKTLMQPRLVSFAADEGYRYTYSQTTLQGTWRPPVLLMLKERITQTYHLSPNSVLCNRYRDGNDSMGRHADDEPELWPDPVIVSMSFGASRTFGFKHKKNPWLTHHLVLHDGDVLIMDKGCQCDRLHHIPKTTKPIKERINLTWRTLIKP